MTFPGKRTALFRTSEPESWGTYIGVLFCLLVFLLLSNILSGLVSGPRVSIGPEIVLLGFAVALLTVFVVLHNERVWVLSTVLGHGLVMISNKVGLGPGEILFAVYVQVGMLIWFCKEVLVYRRQIVSTGFDVLLLMFVIIGGIVAVIAYQMRGSVTNPLVWQDPLTAINEGGVLVNVLLYFPLRKVIRSERDIQILLVVYVVLALINGAVNLMTYRSRLVEAVYAWQIQSSRANANEPVSVALSILGALVFGYGRNRILRLLGGILAAAGLVFVVVSFSRAYIILHLLAFVSLMFMVPRRVSIRLFTVLAISLSAGVILAYLLFPAIFNSLSESIVRRVVSASRGTADLSLSSRIAESRSLLDNWIPSSLLIGNGFGASFTFPDPISGITARPVFIHNAYIWALYKFGIPVTLLLASLVAYPLLRLLTSYPPRRTTFDHALTSGIVAITGVGLAVNFTSNQFTNFDGVLNFTLCWVLLDYIHRKHPILPRSVRLRILSASESEEKQ